MLVHDSFDATLDIWSKRVRSGWCERGDWRLRVVATNAAARLRSERLACSEVVPCIAIVTADLVTARACGCLLVVRCIRHGIR